MTASIEGTSEGQSLTSTRPWNDTPTGQNTLSPTAHGRDSAGRSVSLINNETQSQAMNFISMTVSKVAADKRENMSKELMALFKEWPDHLWEDVSESASLLLKEITDIETIKKTIKTIFWAVKDAPIGTKLTASRFAAANMSEDPKAMRMKVVIRFIENSIFVPTELYPQLYRACRTGIDKDDSPMNTLFADAAMHKKVSQYLLKTLRNVCIYYTNPQSASYPKKVKTHLAKWKLPEINGVHQMLATIEKNEYKGPELRDFE